MTAIDIQFCSELIKRVGTRLYEIAKRADRILSVKELFLTVMEKHLIGVHLELLLQTKVYMKKWKRNSEISKRIKFFT
ncbi:hypothetical protein [Bacillus pseudomycoides]|uniref:hypothetical protein n=1 Tax=Bacillus pseudomycoides TaxID=64104 RepID=UPI000BEDF74A|nr:hypothetical protein [Bacillus pseudomycoides]PEE37090.1 hypothetical protein COO02_24915 [Bacillus pseudomycoides]PEI91437.1 hypothetical protein CN679_14480 [Bacillus pseudomycoides]PGA91058.1 hypothetical protein COL91_11525 [Bacillus pseudomycoides]PHF37494.1 hypothetical protein COF72_23445 [Bacillus pseudomycoides]